MKPAKTSIKSAQIELKVIKADGTVKDYGVVARSGLRWKLLGRHIARRRTKKLNKE